MASKSYRYGIKEPFSLLTVNALVTFEPLLLLKVIALSARQKR
jgi:hypothetical protein